MMTKVVVNVACGLLITDDDVIWLYTFWFWWSTILNVLVDVITVERYYSFEIGDFQSGYVCLLYVGHLQW
jgi:hypothetical protein